MIDTNGELGDNPELVNSDPYGEGWIFKLQPNDASDIEALMDPDAYEAFADAGE